jgi:thiamine biosynthesis protein ThiI
MPPSINRILVQYGELSLKGRNRRDFERMLADNLRHRLRLAELDWPVEQRHQRTYVVVPPDAGEALERALSAIGQVAGIANAAAAVFIPAEETGQLIDPKLERAFDTLVEMARAAHQPGQSFAARVNRADKRVPLKSNKVARELGSAIYTQTPWDRVNLSRPDRSFFLDVYEEGMYCYTDKRKTIGGLPVRSAGRVLALLSGGIDSPVAAYMLAKRGCQVDFIHLTATRVQQTRAEEELVAKIARQLSQYTLRSRVFLVPYTHFDMALMGSETGYDVVLFRRFVSRVAEVLAGRLRAQALVTGDSLGQVASQTLENLVSTSRAAQIPVLRPLIGLDKQEIIDIARRIGTYELSIQPYKDCCALLSENPRTRSYHDQLSRIEERYIPDYPKLIEDTLAEMVCLEYDCGVRVESKTTASA